MNIIKDYLTKNEYSRPGIKLKTIKGIVVHWVANPKTTAKNNRDFFEKRKLGNDLYGSAHYIIGLEGEIINCIPDTEIAFHVGASSYTQIALNELSNYPNNCTLGIECCHEDWTGNFNNRTYKSLLELLKLLCKKYNLNEANVYRHYDITNKDCPKYFVVNTNEWVRLKFDVKDILKC